MQLTEERNCESHRQGSVEHDQESEMMEFGQCQIGREIRKMLEEQSYEALSLLPHIFPYLCIELICSLK